MPRLQALVDQQGSRYHISKETGHYHWEPDRYIADGLLSPFHAAQPTGPNNKILMLVNGALPTAYIENARFPGFQLKLRQWCNDINRQSGFHANGPVRMLVWLPEKEKTSILPHTILYRNSLSLQLEMNCRIEEVASSGAVSRQRQQQRDQSVELMSRRRVARTMQQLGVKVPFGRQLNSQKEIQDAVAPPDKTGSALQISTASLQARGWHDELQTLRQQFEAGDFARAETDPPGKSGEKVPERTQLTPEFARMTELERNLRHIAKRSGEIGIFLREQADIDTLDSQAHDPTLDKAKRLATLQELQNRRVKLKADLDNLKTPRLRADFEFYKQDRRAFAQNPPLLLWDQRSAEPLKAYSEEFYPERDMCLLDVEPHYPLPYPITSAAQASFFSILMASLFRTASNNLRALDGIAPGAFDAITPKVPALHDPTRGGERDLLDLPLRRLTPEMAYGILMAWFDWPFKPELSDLLGRDSSLIEETRR